MAKETPADRVFKAFGGPMDVSRATGIVAQEVYRWRYAKDNGGTGGLVPHQHQATILKAVKKLKLKLEPADLVNTP